jgi:hypothetical protein
MSDPTFCLLRVYGSNASFLYKELDIAINLVMAQDNVTI